MRNFFSVTLLFQPYTRTHFVSLHFIHKNQAKMHRSASWNRYSDDYFKQFSTSQSSGLRPSSSSDGNDQLPVYDPIIELTKKEKARVRFAENAVHAIPLVLFVCAMILWFCSNPDVAFEGDPIKARVFRLDIYGEIDNESNDSHVGITTHTHRKLIGFFHQKT